MKNTYFKLNDFFVDIQDITVIHVSDKRYVFKYEYLVKIPDNYINIINFLIKYRIIISEPKTKYDNMNKEKFLFYHNGTFYDIFNGRLKKIRKTISDSFIIQHIYPQHSVFGLFFNICAKFTRPRMANKFKLRFIK